MNSSTATKLVAVFALGGIGIALVIGKTGSDRYRKVWGITLLSAVGAAMAEFAPSLVGWYFGLIVIAYAIGHQSTITDIAAGVKTQAGVNTPKGGSK